MIVTVGPMLDVWPLAHPLDLTVSGEERPRRGRSSPRSDRASARFPSRTIPGRGGWTPKPVNWPGSVCSSGASSMHEEPATAVIQRYLDALPGDPAAEPVVRELLEQAV